MALNNDVTGRIMNDRNRVVDMTNGVMNTKNEVMKHFSIKLFQVIYELHILLIVVVVVA